MSRVTASQWKPLPRSLHQLQTRAVRIRLECFLLFQVWLPELTELKSGFATQMLCFSEIVSPPGSVKAWSAGERTSEGIIVWGKNIRHQIQTEFLAQNVLGRSTPASSVSLALAAPMDFILGHLLYQGVGKEPAPSATEATTARSDTFGYEAGWIPFDFSESW
uniref:Uncharacterized protein LOC110215816 isoform X2 n=1 Tax=Phascolarctos cinereus TaxID=38626 RepID=A0A6P5LCI4_PHACI|nr:uncharacterized protein LOC110215816 isoform X2 [Phascolarctos cinereus]